MFLGWYDPDRKKPARAKLAEAIERYVEKFGRSPRFCLTSAQDAAELAEPSRKFPGDLPVAVQARSYIARWTYYIGEDAGETYAVESAPAAA
jgi:alkanesulfonate monooxygenase SsuD/methylene tetrahydromethanopterin reductase-like flavin-dependent oxidoreductase (luciferase family)